MGNTWEVYIWQEMSSGPYKFDYVMLWRGESVLMAVWQFIKAKRSQKISCVKLEWR